jgi:hypothetical protein
MNEHVSHGRIWLRLSTADQIKELSNCFLPYKVCSARILRDDSGNGRGVGFAR